MDPSTFERELQLRFAPVLNTLEAERRMIASRNLNVLMVAGSVAALAVLFSFDLAFPPLIVFGIISGGMIYFIWGNKGTSAWQAKYKIEVVSTLVESFFGENGSYEPGSGHTTADFLHTELFNTTPDRFKSEDMIRGYVDKTLIGFSEVHAEYKSTNSKGQTSWHTIFKGILFSADFNKHFHGRTIVKQHSFWRFVEFGNTKLENEAFNDEFSVNTTDPIEARYILTPALMEKILHINKNWGGSLGLSFINAQLFIAIPLKTNFFEVSVWRKVTDGQWQRDWKIIAELVSLVDDLDLNTRIWTKE